MEEVVEGLDAGADDYLTKPFHASELRARVRAAQRILDVHKKLIESQRELEHLATHDPLTQLWNRRAILDRLSQEAARAVRQKSLLAVFLIDVDHFKEVNDRHGHPAGDLVLCEVARRLNGALRPYDSLGRFGGEEFLIVLGVQSPADAASIAERLRTSVAAHPLNAGCGEFPVSISVGVAIASGTAPIDTEALLHAADDALYRAKREGRNRVCAALSDSRQSSVCFHSPNPL
jgi:diguanylate cyclase (GGDEF)-like protein